MLLMRTKGGRRSRKISKVADGWFQVPYTDLASIVPSPIDLNFSPLLSFPSLRQTIIMNSTNGASHTILRPTSVDLKSMGSWGIEGLSKSRFTLDT